MYLLFVILYFLFFKIYILLHYILSSWRMLFYISVMQVFCWWNCSHIWMWEKLFIFTFFMKLISIRFTILGLIFFPLGILKCSSTLFISNRIPAFITICFSVFFPWFLLRFSIYIYIYIYVYIYIYIFFFFSNLTMSCLDIISFLFIAFVVCWNYWIICVNKLEYIQKKYWPLAIVHILFFYLYHPNFGNSKYIILSGFTFSNSSVIPCLYLKILYCRASLVV